MTKVIWLTCAYVSAHVVVANPSSKQERPDLLDEKQASDDGYAVTQTGNAYWAVFYLKSEMCQ